MSENVRHFRDLRVYQRGLEAATVIYESSKVFPPEERFSLTDQIRRSSRSVCANLAEAWRKRRYPTAFVSKLNDAEGEAAETQVWLEISLRSGYLSPQIFEKLDAEYEAILGMLVKMAASPSQWTLLPK